MTNPASSKTTADTSAQAATGKTNVALWALQILLAVAFLFAGGSKLAGAEKMVAVFDKIGVGQWFRYVTGLLEVAGAVLLVLPALAGLGGLLLTCVMAGAVLTHLFVIGGSPLLPLVLLALALVIVWGRRRRIRQLIGGRT